MITTAAAPDIANKIDKIAHFDTLVNKWLAFSAPIKFRLASTEREREEMYRLRCQVVIERGWSEPSAFPDGIERDEYDDVALHLGGWQGDALAATARIVLPAAGRQLPTEHVFGLTVEPRGRVANLDRVAVASQFSKRPRSVVTGLLGATWRELRARGFSRLVGIETRSMIRLYRMLGLEMIEIGPYREYWGELRAPVIFDPTGDTCTTGK